MSDDSDQERLRESLLDLHRAKERERRQRMQAEAMLDGLRALSRASLDDPFTGLFDVLIEHLKADDAVVLSGEGNSGEVRACTHGIPMDEPWPLVGPLKRAVNGQVVLIGDCTAVPRLREHGAVISGRVRSIVCAALGTPGKRSVLLCTHGQRNHFGHQQSRIFEGLAPLAGQAFERLQARERERALLEQTRTQNEALKAEVAERNRAEKQLEDAQFQLIHSEKMSSLGRLVAGMAHEINTPLGVAFTANSVVSESINELQGLHRNRALTKGDLKRLLRAAEDAVALTTQNLERAAEFIKSFKEVSVDRHSQKWRRVEIEGYLNQVITTLQPLIAQSALTISVRSEGPIKFTTLPGAIAQIVTNLVQNALVHAFPKGKIGSIIFTCARRKDTVELRYEDNGAGMQPTTVQSAFEPFFTTQSGAGGSGLGLFIVHELVTGPLSGTIGLHSEPGQGTQIIMSWPIQAPDGTSVRAPYKGSV